MCTRADIHGRTKIQFCCHVHTKRTLMFQEKHAVALSAPTAEVDALRGYLQNGACLVGEHFKDQFKHKMLNCGSGSARLAKNTIPAEISKGDLKRCPFKTTV